MSELVKIAGPNDEPSANVLLVHGLGGHHYDTWRCNGDGCPWDKDPTFWPRWLARDCPALAVYSVGYAASVSRLRGTAMHFTQEATNVLQRVLAEPSLERGSLILIGHSLGGLIIKQLLRTADITKSYQRGADSLIARIRKVAFLATPHLGSELATIGDRLRILVQPSAATASLVRNDPNLHDLNDWYRDWATARGIRHLILTETRPSRIFGMIVPPDTANPGLANVRAVPIAADHIGICKPPHDANDIYIFVRDFVTQPTEYLDSLSAPNLEQLPEVTAQAVVAELQRIGVVAKAANSGVGEQAVLQFARRLRPNEELTLEQAVQEVSAAVDIAIEVVAKGERGTNLDSLVDNVLARIAEKTKAGDIEGAIDEADKGFTEWQRGETHRRQASLQDGIALLEAGLEQDILRRDAVSAARRIQMIVALEHPDE